MKKKLSVHDFPVNQETKNLKIWRNLDIESNALIDINKDEKIYQIVIIPFLFENNKLKILSKINTKTCKITMVMRSNNLITEPRVVNKKEYKEMVEQMEEELSNVLDLARKQVLYGADLYKEINVNLSVSDTP